MKDDIPVLDRLRTSLTEAVDRPRKGRLGPVSPRARWVVAATGVAAAALVSTIVVTAGRDAPRDRAPRALPNPEKTLGGGGGVIESCVEPFNVENLSRREFAFDGTVRSIEVPEGEGDAPTIVTFDVSHWYTGGTGDTAELKTYERPGVVTSASIGQEDGPQLAVGERVLASGDDDYLWTCGFSMLYTPDNASIFDAAFEG